MNDSETDSQSIKALIVFRENGETDNLFVPILCDAIRMAGIDVRCSQKEFWESDTTYDIIHFQWPEEVVGWICEDHDGHPPPERTHRFLPLTGSPFRIHTT